MSISVQLEETPVLFCSSDLSPQILGENEFQSEDNVRLIFFFLRVPECNTTGNGLQSYLCPGIPDIFRNVSKYVLCTLTVSLIGL